MMDIKMERTSFLPARCDPVIQTVASYWFAMDVAECGVPAKQGFDPIDLPPNVWPHLWMVEIGGAPVRCKFRICGSHLVSALGFDPTGSFYHLVFPEFPATDTFAALIAVCETRQGSWRKGEPNLVFPKHEIRIVERVFLPMSSTGEQVDMVLAASVYTYRSTRN